MSEYFLKPLPFDALEELEKMAGAMLANNGTLDIDQSDELPCRRGEAAIWQGDVREGREEELSCLTIYSGGCVHAVGIPPETPLGQMLARLSQTYAYRDDELPS